MGRTDDIINVAGHRLSTGGMEEILASHPDVAECAVLGIKDTIKGEVPCGFLVLKAGVERPVADIEKEVVALVRERSGPSRRSSSPSPSAGCRRRARARSCAAPSRRSPTATAGPCPRPSRIRSRWTKSARR
jgi:acyl-CoA synthetase (AMP-forming)/AMP-acid ligase II